MPKTTLLPSQPQMSYLLKQVSNEEVQDSDNESFCVSPYFDDDDDFEDHIQAGLPMNVYIKWRKAALLVCWISIFFEFVLGFTSLVLSIVYVDPGTFGMAIDSLVDIATTMVVIWRFCGAAGELNSYEREQRAVFGISILFILSSFGVFSKAVFDLVRSRKPYHPYILTAGASISLIAYTALAWAKYVVSQKLRSKVLYTDAINTLCVDIMAAMVLISLLVYKYTSTWFIGSAVAILISAFLFVYGARNAAKACSTPKSKPEKSKFIN